MINKSIKKRLLKPLLITLILIVISIFFFFNLILNYVINLDVYHSNLLININIFFIPIFISLVLIFMFIIIKISTNLSKDIKDLAEDTIKLSKSTYSTEDIKHFDTLELEELNRSINTLGERLFDYYTSQKTTVENASHELRTPLMSIQGYAEGIKCDVFDDISEPIDIIIDSSNHLKDIIESMLILSKMDSHNIKVNYEEICLYNSLNRILNKLRGIAYKENKSIILKGDTSFSFFTDENLLSQAILNIVSNGLRYSKNTVSIEFEVIDDFVLIQIQDDGDGIKENNIDDIFDRFHKGEQGNFGLGLSIARSSIKYLNGKITARNTLKGACFDIKLPIIKDF